jgi:hypothetical protein
VWLRSSAVIILSLVLLGLVRANSQSGVSKETYSGAGVRLDLVFVEASVVSPGGLVDRFPQGSRIVRLRSVRTSDPVASLTSDFFSAADPQVSFDGTKVLFSGLKDRGGHWQVWEMSVDGSNRREVTNCQEDCLRAAYLPGDGIVYTVVKPKEGRQGSYLAVSKGDGSETRRITFGPGDFQVETVLSDGRILTSASWPLLARAEEAGSRLLYTVRPDGTGLESFRCDHLRPAVRGQAEELGDGAVVFIRNSAAKGTAGGELAQVRRDSSHNSTLGPVHSLFLSPHRWGEDGLVVARWIPALKETAGRFDLYSFDVKTESLGERIFGDARFSSLQAVLITPQPAPRLFWSTLKPDSKAGYFICLDSYSSTAGPKGRLSTPIAQVRVLAFEEPNDQERILGEAPVEKDGSFYIAVPADQPVRFELLDSNGQTISAQRSWIWTRPGEEQGCPGCHADKAIAPENRWPLTLRRFDTPTQLGTTNNAANAH